MVVTKHSGNTIYRITQYRKFHSNNSRLRTAIIHARKEDIVVFLVEVASRHQRCSLSPVVRNLYRWVGDMKQPNKKQNSNQQQDDNIRIGKLDMFE